MFSMFRRKNRDRMRWFLTVARQADGGAIVSPGSVYGRSYRLADGELDRYVDWVTQYYKRQIRIGIASGIIMYAACLVVFIMYIEQGWLFFICIAVWLLFILQHALRSFETAFPGASRARDPGKWQRKRLTILVLTPRWFCLFIAIFLSSYYVPLVIFSAVWRDTIVDAVGTSNAIMLYLMLLALTLFYIYLSVEHFRFRRRHGRAPNIDVLGPPLELKREAPL